MTVTGQRTPATWAQQLPASVWEDAAAAVRAATSDDRPCVVICQAPPDGDALGSLLALLLALQRKGGHVLASWGSEPFEVPAAFASLPGVDLLTPPGQLPLHPALLIVVDAADVSRLGTLTPLVGRAERVLVLDHHVGSGWQERADLALVAPTAAATAMIVEELLARIGTRLDRELASCLYVGLVTDTGRFQYPNTDRATMELASRLLDHGIAHDHLSRQIFDTHSFAFIKILARVLDRATLLPAWSLVYSWVTDKDCERLGVARDETEGLIDVLHTVETADVAMLARQAGAEWKVSLRSRGRLDVGRLAERLGGGGFAFAAGFSAPGPIHDLIGRVLDALESADLEVADAEESSGGGS